MEDDRPRGDEKDKPLESKKTSFLESWQQRVGWFSELSNNTEEDEESVEEDEKKDSKETKTGKRWQNLFSKVFSGIVKSSPIETKPSAEKDPVLRETKEQLTPQSTEESLPPEEVPTNPEAVSSEQAPEETPENPSPSTNTEASEAPQHVEATEPTKSEAEVTTTPDTIIAPQEAQDILPMEPPEINTARYRQSVEMPTADQSEQPALRSEVKERVIERDGRGVGVAAGLFGLELLARKRADRKLERKLRNEIKEVSKDLKSEKAEVREKIQSKGKEIQAEAVKSDRERVEPQPPMPVAATEKTFYKPEAHSAPKVKAERSPEHAQPNTTPEIKIDNKIATDTISTEVREKELVAELVGDKLRPQERLRKVAEAAAEEIPVEGYLERSHEIRDESTQPHGAAPVSSILARMNADDTSAFTATAQQIATQSAQEASSPADNPATSAEAYKQAMKNGFWAAITLLVFIGVIVLVRNST